MLKQRILTGAGLACGMAAILLFSEYDWFLKAVAAVLSLMAAYELCRAGGYLKQKAFLFGTMAAAIFFALFGNPKPAGAVLLLAPVISPKKTWEGSVGGSISAVVLLTVAVWILELKGVVHLNIRDLVPYLLIASCISQLGDLTFSAIKRIVGIKDYGTLLPGHGGILDRFDSLLAVIPFTLFVVRRFGPLL